jgi:hypothetical protein
VRQHGVAMAGYDTPAAGWLLPITGEVELVAGHVLSRGIKYRCTGLQLDPQQCSQRREFPLSYPKLKPSDPEPGIFIECGDGRLYYIECT